MMGDHYVVEIRGGDGSFGKQFRKAGFSIAFAHGVKPEQRASYEKACPGVSFYKGDLSGLKPSVIRGYVGDAMDGILCRNLKASPAALLKFFTGCMAFHPKFIAYEPGMADKHIGKELKFVSVERPDICFLVSPEEPGILKLLSGLPEADGALAASALFSFLEGSGKKGAPSPKAKKAVSGNAPADAPDAQEGGLKGKKEESPAVTKKALDEAPGGILRSSFQGYTFSVAEQKRLSSGLPVRVDNKNFHGEVVLLHLPGKKDRLYPFPDAKR